MAVLRSTTLPLILFTCLILHLVDGCQRAGPPPGGRRGPPFTRYWVSPDDLEKITADPDILESGLNISISPPDNVRFMEGDRLMLKANIIPVLPKGLDLRVKFADRKVAKILNTTIGDGMIGRDPEIPRPCLKDGSCADKMTGINRTEGAHRPPVEKVPGTSLTIELKGKRLGRCPVKLLLSNETDEEKEEVSLVDYDLIVMRERSPAFLVYSNVITVLIILINFGFGCELDLKIVWGFLKKPIPPLIGFFCQFLTMPLIGLGVSQLLKMDKIFGFGLIALACSPGGGASNSWTILLGGDINLSLTMTFFSLTLAMAMMPLWLFIVARIYLDPTEVEVPYFVIIQTLAMFVVPCFVGILFNKCRPKWGKKIARFLKPFALFFLLWIFTMGTYVNLYMWKLMGTIPTIIPAGVLLPWLGFLIGFTIATICRQPRYRAITIAIETGIQNVGIPIVMLQQRFQQPEGDLAATMANAVGMFTPIPLYIALIVLAIRRKCCGKKDDQKAIPQDDDDWEIVETDDKKQNGASQMHEEVDKSDIENGEEERNEDNDSKKNVVV